MYALDPDVILAQRFAESRPGMTLVAIVDATIPVAVLKCDIIGQERKQLDLLDEFVLRCIAEGLSTPLDIAGFLGLDVAVIESVMAGLRTRELLNQAIDRRSSLTPAGLEAVRTLLAVTPKRTTLEAITFDRLLWKPLLYPQATLIKRSQAEEEERIVVPPLKTARLGVSDLSARGLNDLYRRGDSAEGIEVLSVLRVSTANNLQLPVSLLVFAGDRPEDFQVAVIVDGEMSFEHEVALRESGATKALGIKIAEPAKAPEIPAEIQAQLSTGEGQQGPPPNEDAEDLETAKVRSVGMHDHPEFLRSALLNTRRRLLIISPWIRGGVVNTTFLSYLERRIRDGVQVDIGYGLGDTDDDCDPQALTRLRNLEARFPNEFRLSRLRNTHAKVLIADDLWINTSFNWLSFKGDPNRTYRMEEGILVRGPELVAKQYEEYLAEIAAERREPPAPPEVRKSRHGRRPPRGAKAGA